MFCFFLNYQRDPSVAGGFPHQRLQLVSTLIMVLSWGEGEAVGGRQAAASPALSVRSGVCPRLTDSQFGDIFTEGAALRLRTRSDVTALNINSLCYVQCHRLTAGNDCAEPV